MGQIQSPQYKHGGGQSQGSSSVKGERAGESFPTTEELDIKKWRQEHAEKMGATGIAGTAKRSTKEYKESEAKYLAEQSKKRNLPQITGPAGTTAKDAAQSLADRKK
jgi:hypothetical protein